MEIDFKQLRRLIQTLEKSSLSEIEIKIGEEKIHLKRGTPATALEPVVSTGTSSPATAENRDDTYVTSPFVGTFYRAAAPDQEPFVSLGDTISPGTVLCIIEAMKLMNEIEAEVSGTITEVLVENGKPVEYGDRLFKLKPSP